MREVPDKMFNSNGRFCCCVFGAVKNREISTTVTPAWPEKVFRNDCEEFQFEAAAVENLECSHVVH